MYVDSGEKSFQQMLVSGQYDSRRGEDFSFDIPWF